VGAELHGVRVPAPARPAALGDAGEPPGRKRGEIRPAEAEAVLFGLKDGQVGPVIELPTGFHVVKLVHRDFAGQMPFDEKVQKQIRDKLRNDLFQKEMKKIVVDLKRRAVIEYSRKVSGNS
jgi:parvulin-like peptidyl-prolyl isomerase